MTWSAPFTSSLLSCLCSFWLKIADSSPQVCLPRAWEHPPTRVLLSIASHRINPNPSVTGIGSQEGFWGRSDGSISEMKGLLNSTRRLLASCADALANEMLLWWLRRWKWRVITTYSQERSHIAPVRVQNPTPFFCFPQSPSWRGSWPSCTVDRVSTCSCRQTEPLMEPRRRTTATVSRRGTRWQHVDRATHSQIAQ